MKELLNKIVTSLEVNADQSVLKFNHPDGTSTMYETEGECCSETWFADIVGITNLLGATVLSAQDITMECVEDGRCRQEFDEFYGVKLTTTKGIVDIVYRNSSNGYYGGNINYVTSLGEYNISLNPSYKDFKYITDDWSA